VVNELDAVIWVAPAFVVFVALVLFGVRAALSRYALAMAMRKATPEERDQFSRKQDLLAFPTLREFYAPRDDFRREWDPDQKKRAPLAWASPYPKAIKSAWKAARKDTPTQLTMVKNQVAAAAQSFAIETLPDDEQPHNAGPEHFSIVLDLNGKPSETVAGLAPTLKSELRLHSLDVVDNGGDFGSVRLVGHAIAPVDRLEMTKPGKAFYDQNPAKSPFEIPLAVTDKGKSWCLETHHTIIYGLTGAGKSSPLNGIAYQLAPFVRAGLVNIWIADLKGTFARPYKDSSLIYRVATNMPSIEKMMADFDEEMMERIAEVETLSDEEQDAFEELTPSRRLNVMLFDEATGTIIKGSKNRSSRLLEHATNVTLLGREMNYLLVAAGQIVRHDIMENLRANIVNGIALRAENTGWSSFVLFGNHLDKRGPLFDSSQIEVANKHNGYKTAGIGYSKGEGGNPERIRFANLSKSEVRALAATFPPRNSSAQEEPTLSVIADEEPEEEFVFEDIADDERDDAFAPINNAPAPRSQVDENATFAKWDDDRLEKNRRAIENNPERMRQTLWLGRLEAVKHEQRIRAGVAASRKPKSAPANNALPAID
jgi:hypothetical protein